MQTQNRESSDLIPASKVEGTDVFARDGNKIGSVKSIMLEKRAGKVSDAVISAGGFLGMGGKYHCVPWSKLNYDTDLGGYKLDVTEDQLRDAPTFADDEEDRIYDRNYQRSVYSHYGVQPYW